MVLRSNKSVVMVVGVRVSLVLTLAIVFMIGSIVIVGTTSYYNSYHSSSSSSSSSPTPTFNRTCFPNDFIFGTASSSYQSEGAYNQDGRGPSIWDTYTHQHPERIASRGNGDVAIDHYHRYKEDVALMKEMGMDAYRFSISWSRILPNGKLSGGVNKKGIQFYNNLINELLLNGLQPSVTLFHWDMPQHLEDEYNGFLSPRIVLDFQDYAELCYKEFGDRVKHWITLNEPWTYTTGGYSLGYFPPSRCSTFVGNCTAGNSAIEPYITAHNQLLAHAAAVRIYKEKYQAHQKGKIGISLNCHWMLPFSQDKNHIDAAQRALDFMFGWFMNPLAYGYYPVNMQKLVGNRLPKFSEEEANMVRGSYDFLGLNYYTGNYAKNALYSNDLKASYQTDSRVDLACERNGIPIGPKSGSSWLYVYPRGFRDLLLYIKGRYNNPTIYITENGIGEIANNTSSLEEALTDNIRIHYHDQHLKFLQQAINEGVKVKGYFAWSFSDNFEWADGYKIRFGVNYVDLKTFKRYPKHSSIWFRSFLLH